MKYTWQWHERIHVAWRVLWCAAHFIVTGVPWDNRSLPRLWQGSWSHLLIQLGSRKGWKQTWIFLDCPSRLVPRRRASRNFRLESKAILKTFIVKMMKEQKPCRIFKCKDRRTSVTFMSILHKVIPSSIQQSFVEGLPCARHSSRYHRYGRCVWISYICKPYIL